MKTYSREEIIFFAEKLGYVFNKSLSSKNDLRFGNNGSLSIDIQKQVYNSFEKQEGGSLKSLFRAKNYYNCKKYKKRFETHPKAPKDPKVADKSKLEYAKKLITESTSKLDNTIVSSYLEQRGIRGNLELPASIKFHPKVYHKNTKVNYPAMIGVIENSLTNEVIGIQRTYLDYKTNYKANIDNNKMILGNLAGGVVKLSGALFNPLILCEGIETGLSIYQATSHCVWCCLSAGNLANIKLPPLSKISEIIIAIDNDDAGIKAGNKASEIYLSQGYNVKIAKPKHPYNDFNDMLKG